MMNAPPFFARGFRPFFLLYGVFSCVLIIPWVGSLIHGWTLPVGVSLSGWHSHEMLYGLVPAAMAGFLLTAIANWTPAPALRGAPLAALACLWLMGRLGLFFSGPLMAANLPYWAIAAVDISFLPVLAAYLTSVLLRFNNHRNLVLAGVLLLLTGGNIAMHVGLYAMEPAWIRAGQRLGLDLTTLMMVIIGGRIIPTFSRNWMRANAIDTSHPEAPPWVTSVAIGSIALLVLFNVIQPSLTNVDLSSVIGGLAILAGLSHGWRLVCWKGWKVRKEPLLWVLHLAYLWIVLALLLRGLGAFSSSVNDSVWQHTLGVGAIGTLILGVMTRVSLGHTGRALQLPRLATAVYFCITISAIARLGVALGWIDFTIGLTLAGVLWVMSGFVFTILYAPILLRTRVDGRPG